MKFHGVVDFIHQQPLLGMFHQIHSQHTSADRVGRSQAQVFDFGRERTDFTFTAAGGVGDPMLRFAVDGRDDPIADHRSADIAFGLLNIFLNVKDRMLGGTKRGFMFQDSLRRVAVVNLGQQPAPRADYRLEHYRVPHRFDGLKGGF